MKRGDLVTVALPGDYGKPRPAVVVQSDLFAEHPSVTILPVTGELREGLFFRIDLKPNLTNGLKEPCQIMTDKIMTIPREKVGKVFGHLDPEVMTAISRVLIVFLGFA